MTEALAIVDRVETALDRPHPREVIRQATEEANVLAEVIEGQRLFSMIQGRRYVRVEGWTTLATLRGCLPREVEVVEMPEGRYVATVELIRMSDGMVLTRASAECGGDGDNIWKGRPANARRSMAITRATGKACRIAFAWVLSLAGRYETTPAEEMDHVANPAPERVDPPRREWPAKGVPPPSAVPDGAPTWRGKFTGVEVKTGVNKGKPCTLHLFVGQDGEKLGTFSETVAAECLKLEGHFIEVVYEPTAKGGKNILSVRDVTLDEVPL